MMASRMAADSDDYFAIGDALASSLGAFALPIATALLVRFVLVRFLE